MKQFPDKHFELAVVDPPYGIGEKFKGGKTGKMNFNEVVEKDWDKVPSSEYWNELFRVSKNQIVWGGNYFPLPPTRCFIVWDKQISEDFSLSMAELAWTSFDKLAKIFKMPTTKNGKIHPTQKPVSLYKWVLENYGKCNSCANKGWIWITHGKQTDCHKCKGLVPKILDTHLGSQSSRIAAYEMGFDFYGCELDPEYFEQGNKRFEAWRKMNGQQLFDFNDFTL